MLRQAYGDDAMFQNRILDKWILHHDNAPSHTAFIVADLLVKMGVTTLPQPPYSPDVAPPDFFCSRKSRGP